VVSVFLSPEEVEEGEEEHDVGLAEVVETLLSMVLVAGRIVPWGQWLFAKRLM
jgi:hypothetical protein